MFVLKNFVEAAATILNYGLEAYKWIVIISALITWVNPDPYNPVVQILRRLTQPVFARIRRWMPFTFVNGIDLSPIVVIFIIFFLQLFVVRSLLEWAHRM